MRYERLALLAMVLMASLPIPFAAKAQSTPQTEQTTTSVRRTLEVPVLMYHYIRPLDGLDATSVRLSVSPKRFASQMKELVDKGYQTITPDELDSALTQGMALPAKPILLTFDDGYYCQYTEALPILKRLGLKATFFIVPGFTSIRGYMFPKTIQALDASGLATIAAHTEHHLDLKNLRLQKMRTEIRNSKADLEKITGHPVTAFAYPYGGFNQTVEREVRAAGFETAFSTLYGARQSSSTIFEIRRIRVMNQSSIDLLIRNAVR